ncbi:MAG: rod shape-determining protein MreD [Nocardioidaceae bacterium]
MSAWMRAVVVGVLVVLTVALQVSVFGHFSLDGVAPDLALLVVVAAGLVRGPSYGALVGFVAGLVLDLAPPADHTAGRWALALVLVGYLVGLARQDRRPSVLATVAIVAAGAFVGTSVFALTGLILQEPGVTVAKAFDVVPLAVLYDVLLTPIVMPLIVLLFRRLEPAERW